MFEGRTLLIATMHGKEKVIAPLLEKALGVTCEIASGFNTDLFGTFSGEVERMHSASDTVRVKCKTAMEKYRYDLAIASEGSFGPHPTLFFAPANEEWLVFIDQKNDLEIMARVLSTETNFAGAEIQTMEQLEAFAEQSRFPSHALIIKNQKEIFQEVAKGITDRSELVQAFQHFKEKYGIAYLETDMRAHLNPTRMKVIEATTHKLLEKIQSTCPGCGIPGFDVTEAVAGLPCSRCGSPTQSILKLIYECRHCHYKKESLYPNTKNSEDPAYCDGCNP